MLTIMVMNLKLIKATVAAVTISVTSTCLAGGDVNLEDLQGVYKHTFPNALMGNAQNWMN